MGFGKQNPDEPSGLIAENFDYSTFSVCRNKKNIFRKCRFAFFFNKCAFFWPRVKNLKNAGRKVFNGLDMFIYQGQKSFYLWNKINPEIDERLIELLNSKLT